MEIMLLLKSIVTLLFVFALIFGTAYLFKKYSNSNLFNFNPGQVKNIKIEEMRILDATRKVALISFKEKKYLILLGNTDLVIDEFKNN
jgi:flagellar biogenesis protein FliO